MDTTEKLEELRKLINLWNYAFSAERVKSFGTDTPYLYLEVGRIMAERLKEEGGEFIKDTPLSTINAVYAYFVEQGYLVEAWARPQSPSGNGDYLLYEKGCIAFESDCWAFYSGGRKPPFCLYYNFLRYLLISRFGIDLKNVETKFKEKTKEEFTKVAFVPASVKDIEAMCIMEELRKSERHEKVIEMSLDAIIAIDESGCITTWNHAAERIFGYTKEEALGMPVENLLSEEDKEKHRKGFKRFIETGLPVVIGKTMEVVGVRKDGSRFPNELSLSAEKVDAKWIFTGVLRDITERKRLESQLRERLDEVERLNKLMVGRELKMDDMRKEIQSLKARIEELEKG